MSVKSVLQELKALGTAQNRKVYARHGVTGPAFGVSYANLGKLVKRIKCDHDLALGLWKSGNHDARVLATMVADPARATLAHLNAWMGDVDSYVIGDAFAKYLGQTRHASKKAVQWAKSPNEWRGAVGWILIAGRAADPTCDDDFFRPYLEEIESDIHDRKNRVRHAMNMALIAIGARGGALEREATRVAKAIGKVHVDHGETGCKTPDAIPYMRKIRAHQVAKAKKAAARKSAKKARA